MKKVPTCLFPSYLTFVARFKLLAWRDSGFETRCLVGSCGRIYHPMYSRGYQLAVTGNAKYSLLSFEHSYLYIINQYSC